MKPLRAIFASLTNALLIVSVLAWNVQVALAQTAALVPNAKQQFFNANGQPLDGGSVYSYVPNTTTPKTTWIDPFEATPNANPVVLDAGGGAFIFGQGNYRQVVKDANGNLIWDGFTSAYGSSAPSGSNGTDTAPVGTVMPFAGSAIPVNWQLAYGQALSRSTFAQLETTITITTSTGNTTSTSTTISGFASTAQVPVGVPIECSCLPTGTTVASITNATTLVVSQAATATGTFTVTVFPWGNGDGVTTFNVPDLRGRTFAGADAMGGTAASRLTSAFYGVSANAPGVSGGAQSTILGTSNIPQFSFTPSGTVSGTIGGSQTLPSIFATGGANNFEATSGPGNSFQNFTVNGSSFSWSGSFSGNAITIGSASPSALRTIQPTLTVNYIIKVAPNTTGAGGVTSLGGMFGDIVCDSTLTCAPQGSPSVNTVRCTTMALGQIGCAKPDGITTVVSPSGVLSAIAGTASQVNVGATVVGSGTTGGLLWDNGGVLGNSVAISGLVLGNGTSAPGVFGGTACTNQVVLALSSSGNASCVTISNSYLATGAYPAVLGTGTLTSGATGAGFTVALGASTVTGQLASANGGCGLASPLAHSLLITEGASPCNLVTFGTAGRLLVDQGSGSDPALVSAGGDVASIAANGAFTLLAATNAVEGKMRGDGTTISCASGVCTAIGAAATSVNAAGATSGTTVANGNAGAILYQANSGGVNYLTSTGTFVYSGGTVGIGTSTPHSTSALDVAGGIQNELNLNGIFPSLNAGFGTYIGWNGDPSVNGETDFVNMFWNGSSNGGFEFWNMNGAGTVNTSPLLKIDNTGNSRTFGNTYVGGGRPWADVMSGANGCAAAIGNGSTNDTSAIQCQINYMQTTYGAGTVFLPCGTYKITSTLTVQKPITLVGEGQACTEITTAGSDLQAILFSNATTQQTLGGGLRDLRVLGYQNGAATNNLVEVDDFVNLTFQNFVIVGGRWALFLCGTCQFPGGNGGGDNQFINGSLSGYGSAAGMLYSHNTGNWFFNIKADGIGQTTGFSIYMDTDSTISSVEESSFYRVDMSGSFSTDALYIQDQDASHLRTIVKFDHAILSNFVHIGFAKWVAFVGSEMNDVAMGTAAVTVVGSWASSTVTATGATCAGNINITC